MRLLLQRRLAVLVALVSLVASLTAQTSPWKSFSYPADGFSASFPSPPEVQKRTIPTTSGSFELRSYTVQSSAVSLFIGVCDFGAQVAKGDPAVILDGARNGALNNSGSHLVNEKKITLGAYRGIAFEAASDQAHLSARIYLVGTTLYQTLVVFPLTGPEPDAARFLDSFQLIRRVAK